MTSDPNIQTLFALNLALILQLLGVILAVSVDPYISKDNRRRVYGVVLHILFLLIEPQFSARYADVLYKNDPHFWYTFLTQIGYIIRPVILYLFIKIAGIEWRNRLLNVVIGINTVIVLTSFFVPWVFYFDPNLHFHRGPLGYVPFIVSFILDLCLLIGSTLKYNGLRRGEGLVPTIISVAVIFSVFADLQLGFAPPVSFLNVAMTESTVFFYIWMHLQFVREHEAALKAEQRIKIMVSQIQPHFMFNTLTTIQALIDIDPEQASEVVEKFAKYLRQNLNSLNQASLIPVRNEIEHTKVYSEIENVRFPSIKIEYDIKDDDFNLPALTIQPMVENAIRHGVRGKKNGRVSISTYRDGNDHVVSIVDNGKGFDVDKMRDEAMKGDHIGVKNVRDRIIDMAGGTFAIESSPDGGTSVMIRIPADRD